MAWEPNHNTEEELEKLAAVREYFHQHFPDARSVIPTITIDWHRYSGLKWTAWADSATPCS